MTLPVLGIPVTPQGILYGALGVASTGAVVVVFLRSLKDNMVANAQKGAAIFESLYRGESETNRKLAAQNKGLRDSLDHITSERDTLLKTQQHRHNLERGSLLDTIEHKIEASGIDSNTLGGE